MTTVTGLRYNDPGYRKAWEALHRERLSLSRKEKYHTTGKARYLRRTYWLNKYKTTKGCEECGYNEHGVAIDFDHIDPSQKKFNISHRLAAATLMSLFDEIRKCRLLCANCHRIKTYKEKQFDPIPRTR